jgi:putative transposase
VSDGVTVHIASGLYAHVVWCTSRRMKAIRKYDVPAVVQAVLEAGERRGVHVHAQAVLRDHVHVLVSYLPTVALAPFVRHAKSESARRVNVGRKDAQRLQWARGYYAGSLSRDHVTATRIYLARQFHRHPDLVPI